MPKRPRGNQNGPGGFLCALTPAGHCPRAWGENKGDGLIGNFYIQGLILRAGPFGVPGPVFGLLAVTAAQMAADLAELVIFAFLAATSRTRVVGCPPGHWRLGKSISVSIGRVVGP